MKTNSGLLLCAVCGVGRLHDKTAHSDVSHKGVNGKVRTFFSECDECGSETADEKQVLQNKREWVRFKKSVDRIPMGAEIQRMRLGLGLTQAQAGQLFGGGPVAFSKYENDDLVPDEAMSNLLYLAIHHPEIATLLATRKEAPLAAGISVESFLGASDECQNWTQVTRANVFLVSTPRYKGIERRNRSPKGPQVEIETNLFSSSNGSDGIWMTQ